MLTEERRSYHRTDSLIFEKININNETHNGFNSEMDNFLKNNCFNNIKI